MEITKIKIKKGVVTIDYDKHVVYGEETYGIKYHEENSVEPHRDFTQALENLKSYLIEIFYWDKIDENIEPLLDITGISLHGKDEKLAVVITGTLETVGKKVAINSPRIMLSGENFGWEDSLSTNITELKNEAEEYLNGKKAQLSIYDALEQDTGEDDNDTGEGEHGEANQDDSEENEENEDENS